MQSKQINFYAMIDELSSIQTWLKKNNCLFITVPIKNINSIYINKIDIKINEGEWDIVYLVTGENSQRIKLKFINSQGHYLIDSLRSPVVEFSRPSIIRDGSLNRSRLYFNNGYYEEREWIDKDKKFISWGTKLISDFKKEVLVKYKTEQATMATPYFVECYNKNNFKLSF